MPRASGRAAGGRVGRGLTAVPGVAVGCAGDRSGGTGVTVVLFDEPARAVVDVRGPASGTYDTASLSLEATFGRRDALFLAGGSVFGLEAGAGVRRALIAARRGSPAFPGGPRLPRVAGAVLYDLRAEVPPARYDRLGFAATREASHGTVPVGRVGAGLGARVAKLEGRDRSVPGGQSSVAADLPGGGWIGLLLVLNSVGRIVGTDGRSLAGPRPPRLRRPGATGRPDAETPGPGTTLAIVATDRAVERRVLWAMAEQVHDGIARCVVPAHTATEGDLVFSASTAPEDTPPGPERRPGATADELGPAAGALVPDAVARLFGRPSGERVLPADRFGRGQGASERVAP